MSHPNWARLLAWAAHAAFLSLALCADVKDSFLEPHRLPTLVQHRQRVLATICGVWEFPQHGGSPEKLELLHTILESYTSMCEAGYEVHVVLVTYSDANETLTMPRHRFYCDRLGTVLPIAIARFELQPLPNGTFGTGGTLASMHRRVFAERMSAGYDVFVAQEDDYMIKAHHVSHFLQWWPRMHDARLYPGFLDFEVWRGDDRFLLSSRPSTRVSWRMSQFDVVAHASNLYLIPGATGQRGYILTSDMLATVMESDWVHKSPTGGEYNPYFNSDWLSEFYTVAFPMIDLWASCVHHASDKYIDMEHAAHRGHTNEAAEQFTTLNLFTLEQVLRLCTSSSSHSRHGSRPDFHLPVNVTFEASTAAPCDACLQQGLNARVKLDRPAAYPALFQKGHSANVEVSVTCK